MSYKRPLIAALAVICLSGGVAHANDADPLLSALEESKTSGKGLTLYVNGQAIGGVIVAIGEKYVVARSTASGTIVIRLDRLDGVAGHVTLPEHK